MMRSLFSGVAGLRTHQTRMDVIGNNIANVNTTSYKSQSMTFSDLMYQTTQSASGANPTTGVGGINARQIGLGAKTSAIKTAITSQGSAQTTNDPFDIMITGESFFVVSNGQENFFTRDGSFYVDGAGNLCMTSTGFNLMGWQPDPTNPAAIKKDTVTALKVMTADTMTYPPEFTTQATVSGNIDANDTDINGDGRMMNLEIYDNKGYKYTVRMNVKAVTSGADDGKYTVSVTDVLDVNGKSIIPDGKTAGDVIDPPTMDLVYNTNSGKFESVSVAGGAAAEKGQIPLTINIGDSFQTVTTDGKSVSTITLDFSSTTNFNTNGVSTIGALKGDKANGVGAGRKVGEMTGISISKDGMIYASYDNGQSRLLGQIAVANFPNASGLAKQGDNLYSATQNSGEFDGIGDDITENGGRMESGVLEMSNVDLAAEFTEMITTQRGFQANSRIITVSDTLLEELTNLKR